MVLSGLLLRVSLFRPVEKVSFSECSGGGGGFGVGIGFLIGQADGVYRTELNDKPFGIGRTVNQLKQGVQPEVQLRKALIFISAYD